jgi:hypothetical protein
MSVPEPHRLPSLVRVLVVPPHDARASGLERVIWLTPYDAEQIGEAALRAGRGTRVEIILPTGTSEAQVSAVRMLFAWLARKGVEVSVRTGDEDA